MIPAVASCLLVWVLIILQTYFQWGNESYYNFGYYVPFLTLYLIYERFRGLSPLKTPKNWPMWAALSLFFFITPAYAFSEVNPYWRAPLWVGGASATIFTLLVIYGLFGKTGLKRVLFPTLFLATMIPWPWRIENQIIMHLTGVVTDISKVLLHSIGYPVTIAGNAFNLGDIAIGVNEACSGIRSFQALFMVALFLGSLFGHSIIQRILVLILLPVVVIAVNSIRAAFLALVVIEEGYDAYNKWHDPAGYVAFIVSMALIYGMIEGLALLIPGKPQKLSKAEKEEAETGKRTQIWPAAFLPKASFLIPKLFWALPALPIALASATEGWFSYKEMTAEAPPSWSIERPPEGERVRHFEIEKIIADTLGYSYGFRFIQAGSRNNLLDVYFYGYEPDNKIGSASSYRHKPTICMEATGAKLLEHLPILEIEIEGYTIPFEHYIFETAGSTDRLHVFWVVWENRNMGIDFDVLNDLNYQMQIEQLIRGRRDFSRHVLLSNVQGNVSSDYARREFESAFRDWFIPGASEPILN